MGPTGCVTLALHLSSLIGAEKQHLLMSKLMGKYAPPLDGIMRDEGDGTERKRCLDLGCGNGSWWVFTSL